MHRGDSSPKLKSLALIQPLDLVTEFVRSLFLVQPNSLSTGCEFCPLEHGEHGLGGEVDLCSYLDMVLAKFWLLLRVILCLPANAGSHR